MFVVTMKTFFVCLIPIIFAFSDSSLRFCPASFNHAESVNGCYKLVLKKMTWDAAVQRCQRLHPRAHLAIVDSAAKQQVMEDMMRPNRRLVDRNCFHPGFHPAVMIGAQRTDPSNGRSPFVWKYPNGTSRPLVYTHWNRGEPNNDNVDVENCAKIYPDWRYYWNDAPCSMVACLMCEVDM